jgi:predicted O-methyltransferase YrrM
MNDRLYAYLVEQTLREPEIIKRLRAKTSRLPRGTLQISPEQRQLMGLLVRLIGARRHSTARSLRLGLATAISPAATRRQRTA